MKPAPGDEGGAGDEEEPKVLVDIYDMLDITVGPEPPYDFFLTATVKVGAGFPRAPALADADRFGSSFAALGDLYVNGGMVVAIGAPGDGFSVNTPGAIHLLSYNADGDLIGTDTIDSGAANGPSAALEDGDEFGSSVANLGDLHGDGNTIIAIGAARDGEGGVGRGAMYLLSYTASGLAGTTKIPSVSKDTVVDNTRSFGADYDRFGAGIANLGDLYGDGGTVVAVGAPGDDTGGNNRGSVFLLSFDAAGQLNSDAVATITHGTEAADTSAIALGDDSFFGSSVANLGDLDGGGGAVLAVGAARDGQGAVHFLSYDAGGNLAAIRKILYASAAEIAAGTTSLPLDTHQSFGASVANLGDLYGNGRTIVAIGAPGDDAANAGDPGFDKTHDRGAVYLLSFNNIGKVTAIDRIAHNTVNGPVLGRSSRFGSGVGGTARNFPEDGDTLVFVGAEENFLRDEEGSIYMIRYSEPSDAFICVNGVPAEGSPAAGVVEQKCATCDSNFYLAGSLCEPNAYICPGGVVYAGEDVPDAHREIRCVSCSASHTLIGVAGEKGSKCERPAFPYICEYGAVEPGTTTLSGGVTNCSSCNAGYTLENSAFISGTKKCVPEFNYICPGGRVILQRHASFTPPSAANEVWCLDCVIGYYLDGRACKLRGKYFCDHGTAERGGPPRSESDEHKCAVCDTGYAKDSAGACDTCASGYHRGSSLAPCVINEYVCANGTPAEGTPTGGGNANVNRCQACDVGYYLDTTDFSCGTTEPANVAVCRDYGSRNDPSVYEKGQGCAVR